MPAVPELPAALITVRVVLALPDQAREAIVQVPDGTTARDAVSLAVSTGLVIDDTGFDVASGPIGIHGRLVADAEPVLDGDRVELYRPMMQDPMDRRRRVAAKASDKR